MTRTNVIRMVLAGRTRLPVSAVIACLSANGHPHETEESIASVATPWGHVVREIDVQGQKGKVRAFCCR